MSDTSDSLRSSRRRLLYAILIAVALALPLLVYTLQDDSDSTDFSSAEEVGVFEHAAPFAASADSAPAPTEWQRAELRASIVRAHSALAEKPYDPLLLNNFAWALHLAGRYDHAESTLRQVIQIDPQRAIAYANLGETLWKQGKNAEAAQMYRHFLTLNKNKRREAIAQRKIDSIVADAQLPDPPLHLR